MQGYYFWEYGQFALRETTAAIHSTGSCIHQKIDDEYNYHDSMQAHLMERIGL